jgi:hypothetical protein
MTTADPDPLDTPEQARRRAGGSHSVPPGAPPSAAVPNADANADAPPSPTAPGAETSPAAANPTSDPASGPAPAGPAASGRTTAASSTTRAAGSGPAAPRADDARTSSAPGPDHAFPVPHGPRTTGPGGHVLGVLIGLVLTGAALFVLLLGQSRILSGGVGQETVSADALGITLVTVGSLLAALVALLAVRTSAIPFTGGLLALLVGAAYLFAPVASHRETVRLLATEQNRDAVLTTTSAAMAGAPFTIGLVLLATGTAASLVRRRGIEVGSFRARSAGHGTAQRS